MRHNYTSFSFVYCGIVANTQMALLRWIARLIRCVEQGRIEITALPPVAVCKRRPGLLPGRGPLHRMNPWSRLRKSRHFKIILDEDRYWNIFIETLIDSINGNNYKREQYYSSANFSIYLYNRLIQQIIQASTSN